MQIGLRLPRLCGGRGAFLCGNVKDVLVVFPNFLPSDRASARLLCHLRPMPEDGTKGVAPVNRQIRPGAGIRAGGPAATAAFWSVE